MKIEPFDTDDIDHFLLLARCEGWIVEHWELEFLLSEFSRGCFVARAKSGELLGFVTSLRHQHSGWIGNLIVTTASRGRGIGEQLFKKAMEAQLASGSETVWLTASKSGLPLYQKSGFTRIDTIIRWSGSGRQRTTLQETIRNDITTDSLLIDIDSKAWGDRRYALLEATSNRGRVLQQESGFVVVQDFNNNRQLGPFSAPSYSTADALLKAALNTMPFGTQFYLDAPQSNRTALKLFNRNRMRITGSNELMYAGVKPAYRPELLYGMATMGSCG